MKSNKVKKKKYFILTVLPFALVMLAPALAHAQTPPVPQPSKAPLESNLLQAKTTPTNGRKVITADTISQTGLTTPSLWWAKEQFAGKMLDNWLAYPDEKRVDLVVNRQLWTLLDYIGRYSFVNQLGTVARQNGYNTRVFNQQKVLLATYTCNFSLAQPVCNIQFESDLQDSLRVN